jgi:hypothetical protein
MGDPIVTPEERLVRDVRELLQWARIHAPETVTRGGLLRDLADALRAYDDARAKAQEATR